MCEPRTPSKFPDGKPCQASANWSAATSQPVRAKPQLAAAERGAQAVTAKRLARARPGHAVGREPSPLLEPSQGRLRAGAEDAVHGSGVDASLLQPDLKRRDIGISAGKRSAGQRQGGDDEQKQRDGEKFWA